LDISIDDTVVAIKGYNTYGRDRTAYGRCVAIDIHSHVPVMLREDLMSSVIEVLWFQVHLPHLKPIILGVLL
jgi:hypothetical protein